MSAGAIVVAVLAFALLVVIHEAGHAIAARLSGMRVERFSVGFGPVLFSARRGDTEYAVSALPLGGYVKISGMAPGEDVAPGDPASYSSQPAWRRFAVIAAGPIMNYLLAVAIATSLAATTGFPAADPAAHVGEVLPGSPASQAGLREGDRILTVAGQPVASWNDLVAAIQGNPGKEVPVAVERDEGGEARRLDLVLVPRDDGGVGKAGFRPFLLRERRPWGPGAVALGLKRTHLAAVANLTALGQVFTRKPGAPELSGPIGIGQELARAAHAGGEALLGILWNISLALALLNLLPVPGLDGGRLVFLVYEMVARRPVNQRVESIVHAVGIVALLILILAVTVFGDLARMLGR